MFFFRNKIQRQGAEVKTPIFVRLKGFFDNNDQETLLRKNSRGVRPFYAPGMLRYRHLSTTTGVKTSDKKRNGRLCDSRNEAASSLSAFSRQEAAGSIACSCNWRETRLTRLSIFITGESCSFKSRIIVGSLFATGYTRSREKKKRSWIKKIQAMHVLIYTAIFNLKKISRHSQHCIIKSNLTRHDARLK